MNRWVAAGTAAAGVVTLDRVTKVWAEATLPGSTIVVVEGWLAFQYAENPGASFGILQGAGPYLAVAAVVAVGVIAAMLRSARSTAEAVGLGLVAGGAVGNLIDRLVRGEGVADGAVVDFIRIPLIPNFNVADAALTVGVVVLLAVSLRRDAHAD